MPEAGAPERERAAPSRRRPLSRQEGGDQPRFFMCLDARLMHRSVTVFEQTG